MTAKYMISLKRLSCLSAMLIMLAWAIAPQAAMAKSKSEKAPGIVLPVFYLTDRDKDGDSFGPARKYPIECLHQMDYGIGYVQVDETGAIDEVHKKLGWEQGAEKAPKICRKDRIEKGEDPENKAEFFARLEKAIENSGDNRVCIFVHGAADPFEDAIYDAGGLAYYMECPTIIYSWPSVGTISAYHIDEGNCEWSQEHYNTFMSDMGDFAAKHPHLKITLVAHSMGTRLVARSTAVLRHSKGVHAHDIALVSPDIDAGTFMHYVKHHHNRGTKVRLYVSRRDKVLSYTQLLYGGYYRIGEEVGPVLAMVSQDHHTSVAGAKAPKMRSKFEKIDYTELDTKWIGHHFPTSLVACMSRDQGPGPGLKLVPEIVTGGNNSSRYAKWRFGKINNIGSTFKGMLKRDKDSDDKSGSATADSDDNKRATDTTASTDASNEEGSSCLRVVFEDPKAH